MRVFLSWSGEVSHRVALALEKWLPFFIQDLEPFSSSDINKGDKWNAVLSNKLKDAQYGIICVTPYNTHKAWMNFEAGALSRAIDSTCVVPFLFHVAPDDLDGPLAQFQFALYRRDDVFTMLRDINRLLPKPLADSILETTFTQFWDQLDSDLKNVSLISDDETRAYYPWLYTRDDAQQSFADNSAYKSVWVITMDAGRYFDRTMKDLILEGSKAGTEFRYFLPESEDYLPELRAMADASQKKFTFKCFESEYFETQATSDYILFNPDGVGDLRALVRIPLGDHVHGEYWFKAGERSGRNFVSRFRDLWGKPAKVSS